jgi:hypothetical protein
MIMMLFKLGRRDKASSKTDVLEVLPSPWQNLLFHIPTWFNLRIFF